MKCPYCGGETVQRKAIGFDLGAGYVAAANERSGVVRPETAKANEQIGLLAGMEDGR